MDVLGLEDDQHLVGQVLHLRETVLFAVEQRRVQARQGSALQVSQAELPHLQTQMTQFEALVSMAEDLFQSQAALSASKPAPRPAGGMPGVAPAALDG